MPNSFYWPKFLHWSPALLLIGLMLIPTGGLIAQQDEMELINKITALQEKLESQQVSERDAAEKELLEIGVKVLDYMEPVDDKTTTDTRERIARIRKALEVKAVEAISNASQVTLTGEMTVEDALKKLKKQTGNNVMSEYPALLQKKVKLESKDVEFWRAMDELMTQAGMSVDAYGGEPNTIKLVQSGQPNPATGQVTKALPTVYSKIFQIQAGTIVSAMNLGNPSQSYTDLGVVVRWEPRLRPISVDLPMKTVKVIDEFGDAIKIEQNERVIYGMVQAELPQVEFTLRLPRIDRQIEQLKTITGKIDAVLPGRVETFRFKNIGEQKQGRKMEKAGATVTFGGINKNEDLWSLIVSLSFDEEHNALESHQGWVFQNELYLQNAKGEKATSVGSETIQQDNSRVTVKYFFLEEPGTRTLVYKTPAAIVKMPVEFTLKKIPLP